MDQANSLRKIINTNIENIKGHLSLGKTNMEKTNSSKVKAAPRVISVTSGKGGVGKTNVVGNFAIAFSKLGLKVLVFDADLGLANIDIIFGVNPKYNIDHVLRGEKEISEIIVDGPEGVKIIPAGSGFANLTNLTKGQKLNLLSEFEIFNDNLDIMLVDTGAGISTNVVYFNLAADECIIVATSEPTSNTDAYAMMKVMFTKYGTKHFKLLVNMVKNDSEAKMVYMNLSRAADRFLNGVVVEYIGYVPDDDLIRKAVKSRSTVMKMYPNAASSIKFKKIASTLLEMPRRFDSDGNMKFFLKRFMDYR